jgi:putative transposase
MKYKNNQNIVFNCKYHIVWCPKYRRKILKGNLDKRLQLLINKKAKELGVDIIEMETDLDHIHLLLECDPQYGVHRVIKQLKGYTSKILRDEFPYLKTKLPSLWTNSYFISTVGGAPLEQIKEYVKNQKTSQRK